ncbi:MAG: hypothetical protein R3220_07155 [Balneolaceae bacterium]|nr:hypothetical protein [Balneolaceae bacterium]
MRSSTEEGSTSTDEFISSVEWKGQEANVPITAGINSGLVRIVLLLSDFTANHSPQGEMREPVIHHRFILS